MAGRKRNMFIACIVLVVGVAVFVAFASRGGKAKVELHFVGFTNRMVVHVASGGTPMWVTNHEPAVVFMASNSGSRNVMLSPIGSFGGLGDNRIHIIYGTNLFNSQLKPGKSTTVFSSVDGTGYPFRARLNYHEFGLRDRLTGRLLSSTNRFSRKLGARLYKQRAVLETYSDWLTAPLNLELPPSDVPLGKPGETIYRTNAPTHYRIPKPELPVSVPPKFPARGKIATDVIVPGATPSRYNITAPPPPVDYDLRDGR